MRPAGWRALLGPTAVALFAAAVASCAGGDTVVAPAGITLRLTGRLERGATMHATLLDANNLALAGTIAVTVTPAASAVVAGDSVTWLQAGAVTVRGASLIGADSVRASTAIVVAAPPLIVFDAVRTDPGPPPTGNRDIYAVALDGFDFVRVTSDPADDQASSARSGAVVFVSTRSGSAEIWRAPITGGAATRITTNAIVESDPRLSPDGTRVAYVDNTGGFPRVWTVNVNGTAAARLAAADPAGLSIEGAPAWSPDGTRLAYSTTRDATGTAIYIGAVGGASNSATLAVGGAGAGNNVEPAWSPDGQKLCFASNRAGATDLYVTTVGSGTTTRLTTRGNVGHPAWLADGRIVFQELVTGAYQLRWIDPADTSKVYPINVGAGGGQRPQPGR